MGRAAVLSVGLVAVAIGLFGGCSLGLTAAYYGGLWGQAVMRAMDGLASIPLLIWAIAVVGIIGVGPLWIGPVAFPNETKLILLVGLFYMPPLARVTYGGALAEAASDYVRARRSQGAGNLAIMLGDILPNCLSPVIVQATLLIAVGIVVEASLSFIGLGVEPPNPSWGSMLADARNYIFTGQWWMSVCPGIAISLSVIGFNLLGDALRDALDPRRTLGDGARHRVDRLMALLDVEDLRVGFPVGARMIEVVRGVSFRVDAGEALGLVGESGSGKSQTALAILRLLKPPGRILGGRVRFAGEDITALDDRAMARLRGAGISIVFQDAMAALNPAFAVGTQLEDVIMAHRPVPRRVARDRAVEALARVGIPEPAARLGAYPHQFSGGMRQRVVIAMAVACGPQLLLADEPTTALDVTVQKQIVRLLAGLRAELGLGLLFITHNLDLMAEICDRAVVLYGGMVMEEAPVADLFARPLQPYTRALLACVPRLRDVPGQFGVIEGAPPVAGRLGAGCPFEPRCGHRLDVCAVERPQERAAGTGRVACWAA